MNEQISNKIQFVLNKIKKIINITEFDFDELTERISPVKPYSSIVEAMDIFNKEQISAIPVVSLENEVIGVITQKDIAHLIALQSIVGWSALRNYKVDSVFFNQAKVITKDASLEEIAVEFTGKNVELISVIDKDNKYTGYCITTSKLIGYTSSSIKPRSIGGLATPLGVYLTDGYYSGGAGNLGLILTGLLFSVTLNTLAILTLIFLTPFRISDSLMLVIQLVLFLFILRISPMSGYHAAEHQTIHAIEKGLELTLENVKNQPKEHDRCGTNLMILMLGLSLIFLISLDYLQNLNVFEHTLVLIMFSILVISGWKRVGMSLQSFFTTSTPTDKQLLSGIKAAQELLEYYDNNNNPVRITIFHKLWNMGIIQVLFTFIIVSIIIQTIVTYLWPMLIVCATI